MPVTEVKPDVRLTPHLNHLTATHVGGSHSPGEPPQVATSQGEDLLTRKAMPAYYSTVKPGDIYIWIPVDSDKGR